MGRSSFFRQGNHRKEESMSRSTKRLWSNGVTEFRFILVGLLLWCAALPAAAQVVTGTLGSPSATTTIDGKQLPPPSPPFGGVIKPSALDSTSWWAPTVAPPKGAPNVLLIMTDD